MPFTSPLLLGGGGEGEVGFGRIAPTRSDRQSLRRLRRDRGRAHAGADPAGPMAAGSSPWRRVRRSRTSSGSIPRRGASSRSTASTFPAGSRAPCAPGASGSRWTAIFRASCGAARAAPETDPNRGSTARSSRPIARCTARGTPTASRPGARSGWSAASTAWRWEPRSSARACSAPSGTRARSRWCIWSPASGPAPSRSSIPSS